MQTSEDLFTFPEHDQLTMRESERLMRNDNIPKSPIDYLHKFDKHIYFRPITYKQTKNPFYKISMGDHKWIRNLLRELVALHHHCKTNGEFSEPIYQLMQLDCPLKNSAHQKQNWLALFAGIIDKHHKDHRKSDFSKKQFDAISLFLNLLRNDYAIKDIVLDEVQ